MAPREEVDAARHHDEDAQRRVVFGEALASSASEQKIGLWQALKLYPKATAWSILFSTAIIMEGYDTLLLGGLYALPAFEQKFGSRLPDGSFQITAAWQNGLSNAPLVGEILGLTINGWIADRYGYRYTLIGALTLVVCFVFLTFFAQNLIQLVIGEILLGIPWGVFQTITTTYASEVCPTHLRAYLTTYVNLCWVIGQLFGTAVLRGTLSFDNQWGYRIPFALQWMWPIPLIIGVFLAPESPWWLVRKGRVEEAKHSLLRLTSRNSEVPFNVDETIAMMRNTDEMEKMVSEGTGYSDLFRNSVSRRRTEIVCVVWSIQNLCGSSLQGYSTYFYKQAGLSAANAFNLSLGNYALGAVGTISSWFFMTWFGRRTLYLYGLVAMVVLLLVIGFTSLAPMEENSAPQWAIGSLLILFSFVYDATVGPVCFSLVAELPSTRLKTKSVVLARNIYNVIGLITGTITTRMLNPLAWGWGAHSAFFWAGSAFLCATWTFFRLPEPKGRTYAEMDVLFEDRVPARKFSSTVVNTMSGSAVQEIEKIKMEETVEDVNSVEN